MRSALPIALLLFAAPAFAQPLVERIEVRVVDVDVTVTHHGQPVKGLTRDDFEIFEDGKPQPITNFHVVENADIRPDAATPAESASHFLRKVLVLIDDTEITRHARDVALQRLESFINERFDADYEWSIASIDARVHLLLPLTRDKEAIRTAFRAARLEPTHKDVKTPTTDKDDAPARWIDAPRSGFAEQFVEAAESRQRLMRVGDPVAIITNAVRSFGAIDGRKIVLLITATLPLSTFNPLVDSMQPQFITAHNRLMMIARDRLIREANASNASLYIIGAEGLDPDRAGGDTSAMYWISRETGGKYLPGNFIDVSLREFDSLSGNFYSLGYRPQHGDDHKYHSVKVRVKGHREYAVASRDGYAGVTREEQLMRTLRSPIGATMQPATLPIVVDAEPSTCGKVPLHVSIPMNGIEYIEEEGAPHARVHLYVSVFGASGENLALRKYIQDVVLDPGEQRVGKRIRITIPGLVFGKGSYRIVVAVRDEITDAVGLTVADVTISTTG